MQNKNLLDVNIHVLNLGEKWKPLKELCREDFADVLVNCSEISGGPKATAQPARVRHFIIKRVKNVRKQFPS